MNRFLRILLQVVATAWLSIIAAIAPAWSDGTAGKFDFYLLSLSWSPTYCLEMDDEGRQPAQCDARADHAFIVHGLWPQYENGYPDYCRTDYPQRLPRSLIETVLDIMPGVGLVGSQWRKHGTCSGLTPGDYLALVRAASNRVVVPDPFEQADQARTLSAEQVEAAFASANPGLEPDGIALACRDGRLREVRICLTTELEFRSCREVDRNGCRSARLSMPEAE